VDHHLEKLGVHLGDHRRQVGAFEAVVRRITQDAKAEGLGGVPRHGGEGGEQGECSPAHGAWPKR
jgi:hypothetical protein